jgi:hypothetical protein
VLPAVQYFGSSTPQEESTGRTQRVQSITGWTYAHELQPFGTRGAHLCQPTLHWEQEVHHSAFGRGSPSSNRPISVAGDRAHGSEGVRTLLAHTSGCESEGFATVTGKVGERSADLSLAMGAWSAANDPDGSATGVEVDPGPSTRRLGSASYGSNPVPSWTRGGGAD